jgi:hypothetical protein
MQLEQAGKKLEKKIVARLLEKEKSGLAGTSEWMSLCDGSS